MKDRGDFLLEIGCEEIPAGIIPRAIEQLKQTLEKLLSTHGLLEGATVETFGAPRRITGVITSVLLRQEDVAREITGPPKSIAFDNVGQPTRAAYSFAEKQGIPIEKLTTVVTAKGEFLSSRQVIVGRSTRDLLAENLPQAILSLSFPRPMYWSGAGGPRFVRPIRWIVALLDGKVVAFNAAGVESGSETSGHRFLGKAKIPVRGPDDYVTKLRSNFVIVHAADRRKKIDHEIQGLVARKNWQTHADPGLLEMVTYLNEYPTVICWAISIRPSSNFPKRY